MYRQESLKLEEYQREFGIKWQKELDSTPGISNVDRNLVEEYEEAIASGKWCKNVESPDEIKCVYRLSISLYYQKLTDFIFRVRAAAKATTANQLTEDDEVEKMLKKLEFVQLADGDEEGLVRLVLEMQ